MKKSVLCILLALCMILSLAACGSTGEKGGPKGEDEFVSLVCGCTRFLGSFLLAGDVTANDNACSLVYDTLWIIDPDTNEIRSDVLEDWYYEDDLTFVIKLKEGVYFSNGVEATSEDVLYSLIQLILRGSPMQGTYGNIDMDACSCPDKYTCVIKWTDPWGPGVSRFNTYLYSKAYCEEKGWDSTDWLYNPLGTGPYALTEYEADDYMKLELRDDYWNKDKEFWVDEWTVRLFPDASTLAMELENGTVDITGGISTNDYLRYKTEGDSLNIGLKVVNSNDVMHMLLAYENTDAFDDIAVRKAIAHGVDWNALGEMAYGDLATPATAILSSTSSFYTDVGAYEYDPDYAKQVLKDAGYSDGDIVLHLYTMEKYTDISEGLQFYLNQIGITLNPEFGDTVSVLSAWMQPGGTDIGWQNNPDYCTGEPYSTLVQLQPDSNVFVHGLCTDPKFGELSNKGLHTVDEAARVEIYHELLQYVHDNYLTMPICEYSAVVAYRSDVFTSAQIDKNVLSASNILLREISMSK